MASEYQKTFESTVGKYFNDPEFSDAIIECDGHKFNIHQVVVAAHSPVLKKAFAGEWKESKERKMTIDDNPAVIEAMLTYMYCYNYDTGSLLKSRPGAMVFDVQVYSVAELYDIAALKEYSKENFESAIKVGWALNDFPQAITEAFSSTPEADRGLRDPIVKTCAEHIKDLIVKPAFKKVLRETSTFAADLTQAISGGATQKCSLQAYKCPNCSFFWHGNVTSNRTNYYCPACGSAYHNSNWTSSYKVSQ